MQSELETIFQTWGVNPEELQFLSLIHSPSSFPPVSHMWMSTIAKSLSGNKGNLLTKHSLKFIQTNLDNTRRKRRLGLRWRPREVMGEGHCTGRQAWGGILGKEQRQRSHQSVRRNKHHRTSPPTFLRPRWPSSNLFQLQCLLFYICDYPHWEKLWAKYLCS